MDVQEERSIKPAERQERRAYPRHAVDTTARLLLVNSAITMAGRIQNLSMGGCCIRTEKRFTVGIFVRVEVEFYFRAVPFRVAGVTQVIQDTHTIGVRFLDMSDSRRVQLKNLITEIEEAGALDAAAGEAP